MRIAVDARSLTTRPTGVGHFLLAAVNVWANQEPDVEFLLMAHKPLHAHARAALRASNKVRFDECPNKFQRGNGVFWLLTKFSKQAKKLGATHIWGPAGILPLFGQGKLDTLLTVHDLVYRELPKTTTFRTRLVHNLLTGISIRRATYLWAVSRYTAEQISRHYPKRKAFEIDVGSGLNPWRANGAADSKFIFDTARRYQADELTLLFVGTLEPRKNLRFLLTLMPRLAAQGWRLLIVGGKGWGVGDHRKMLDESNLPIGSVKFCDYVSDIELSALYHSVGFFISTSLMEGFGLPHLEAMAAGCPVIASDNSAIPEVVGDGGILVSGWNPNDWCAAIETAKKRREQLKMAAPRQAKAHDIGKVCSKVMSRLTSNMDYR